MSQQILRRGTRVLVVEDDQSISRLLQLELEHRGIVVQVVRHGSEAIGAVATFNPHAIVLDILLPGMDGERILYELRHQGVTIPVVMLTARDRASDKVRSLDSGADDYLTKPFHIEELLARLRAVLRRATPDEVLRVGGLDLNLTSREVRQDGQPVELTTREYELLELLMRNARHVVSRDQILDEVWRELPDANPNVVDVYIGYLRKKIGSDAESSPVIRTVRGVGFTIRER